VTKRLWEDKNRERNNKKRRERYANDPLYRFACCARARVHAYLKGKSKSKTTEQILSCTFEEAWNLLIPRLRFPMTKENYGKVWHVDHIRPICSFDLSDPEQVKACFHYTNLQPLFVEENRKKGGRY
jgi:HNH endonuclease.